ncbi:MAG TPA: glycosyltransferase [Candidatus Dormibacteraeota bacterium]
MEVHQLLASAAFGDAITNEALALQPHLRRLGPSEIFAVHLDRARAPGVKPLEDYAGLPSAAGGDNILLLHHSIGLAEMWEFLQARRERMVVRYHNVTPPEYFEPYDLAFARLLREGRDWLPHLAERAVAALADSSYNAGELREAGFERVLVEPVVVDVGGLKKLRPRQPDPPLPERGPAVLFVGRIVPNKGQHRLLAAFHVLKTYLQPEASLHLAGKPGQRTYYSRLQRFASELALPDVRFSGEISTAELAAFYRRADVFLCLSEHEGFCVPLLEAMSFDVPIVAWDTTAVGETSGGAALLLSRATPSLVAEAVNAVISDGHLRRDLVERGRKRLAELAPERAAARLIEGIKALT